MHLRLEKFDPLIAVWIAQAQQTQYVTSEYSYQTVWMRRLS